ncbi:MAG: sel1 repeat family protein [Nitratireductor sp.]|nr:sel1 repeat family protein [Nitratireductor sp.]
MTGKHGFLKTLALFLLIAGTSQLVQAQTSNSRGDEIRSALNLAAGDLSWAGEVEAVPLASDAVSYIIREPVGMIAITEYQTDAAAEAAFEAGLDSETEFHGNRASGGLDSATMSWLSGRLVLSVASGAGDADDLAEALYSATADGDLASQPDENRLSEDEGQTKADGTKVGETADTADKTGKTAAVGSSAVTITGQGETGTDGDWKVTVDDPGTPAWMYPGYDDSGWQNAVADWQRKPAAPTAIAGMEDTGASWIWHRDDPDQVFFRREIDMHYHPLAAILRITADNEYAVYLNGGMIGEDTGDSASVWNRAESYDIAPYLRDGKNVIAIVARDYGGGSGLLLDVNFGGPSTLPGQANGAPEPTGQLASGRYRVDTSVNGASYPSEWSLIIDNGRITGTSEWSCCPGPRIDPLAGFVSGNKVMIERDCSGQGHVGPCKQTYDGSIMNGRLEGTFTGTGVIGAATSWVFSLDNLMTQPSGQSASTPSGLVPPPTGQKQPGAIASGTPQSAQSLVDEGKRLFSQAHSLADNGMRQDAFAKVLALFQQAQEMGSAEAIYMIGYLYEVGSGVQQDNDIAASHYEEAARSGYAEAYTQLMLIQNQLRRYEQAAGTFFNYYKAFPQQAEQGFADYAYSPQVLRAIQVELQRAGYYRGGIDGIIGPGTRAAIRQYVEDRVPDELIHSDDGAQAISPTPVQPAGQQQKYYTPAKGTAERSAIMDAARVPINSELGQQVIFVVDQLRTDGRWVFLQANPRKPDGTQINWNATQFAGAWRADTMSDVVMVLLENRNGIYRVVDYVIGPTDVYWYNWVDTYRLPERFFFPG